MSDYKDIWSDAGQGRPAITEEQLMAYLEGRMSPDERRALEELLSNEGLESDAIEGLQALTPEETRTLKLGLNAGLQKTLNKKKRRRRGMSDQRWTWVAVLVILLLAILGYAVIYLARQH